MVKYYIKITDEEPLESEKALWFELETDDETGNAEFFVLDRNEYNSLVGEFASVKNNLKEDVVEPLVEEVLENEDVPHATRSDYIANPNNPNQNYSYSQLVSTFNSKADKTSVISLEQSKADTQTVTSLQNTISQKAPLAHTHTGWNYKSLNNYASIYYNDAIRICHFRYYRTGYNFTKTDAITLHSALIPSAYRPPTDVILPFYHYHLVGYIDDTGDFIIMSDTKATYTINTSAFWRY